MALLTHLVATKFVAGTKRWEIGSFFNFGDDAGTVQTSLATITNFSVSNATGTDSDAVWCRNSADVSGEYDNSPTVAHLGGKLSFDGLPTAAETHRYFVMGV